MTYPHNQHQPAARRRRVWPWIVGGVALVIVVGAAASGGPDTGTAPSHSTATGPASIPAPAAPTGPLTTFGNGTYAVGQDIAPGQYRSPAPQAGIVPLCYWDITDANGKILDQGVANEGPSRATLKTGRTFKSSGCEDWTRVGG